MITKINLLKKNIKEASLKRYNENKAMILSFMTTDSIIQVGVNLLIKYRMITLQITYNVK